VLLTKKNKDDIIYPSNIVRNVSKIIEKYDFKILITHYPLNFLNENCRKAISDLIHKHFDCHFTGHSHEHELSCCQYYDCFMAQELWYKVSEQNYTYSIDYLIGNENYLNKGYGKEIVRQLIDKIRMENGKEIIAQPDEKNVKSNKVLLANGFTYKAMEKYFYKNLATNIIFDKMNTDEINNDAYGEKYAYEKRT